MRTEMEEALFVQNVTIVELGEENIRLNAELEKWTKRQPDYANYRRGVEDGNGACQAQIKSDGEKAVAMINKLRSALDKIALMTCCDYNENEYVVSVHGIAKAALEI